MDAQTNMQNASPAPDATSTATKPRHKPIVRFPYQFHFGITPAMRDSLARITAHGLLAEADCGRLAMAAWLRANDPQYREGPRHNNGNGR